MPSPRASKAKGSLFERELADYFRETGLFPSAERAPRWGSVDKGDLVNTGDFLVEAKAVKSIDLPTFLAEAEVEATNAGRAWPIVVVKRRMKPIGMAYVVQSLDNFVERELARG